VSRQLSKKMSGCDVGVQYIEEHAIVSCLNFYRSLYTVTILQLQAPRQVSGTT
jgi:hypothetical protein